jgi:hypothetical protein
MEVDIDFVALLLLSSRHIYTVELVQLKVQVDKCQCNLLQCGLLKHECLNVEPILTS